MNVQQLEAWMNAAVDLLRDRRMSVEFFKGCVDVRSELLRQFGQVSRLRAEARYRGDRSWPEAQAEDDASRADIDIDAVLKSTFGDLRAAHQQSEVVE
jgi:hypothetical protein